MRSIKILFLLLLFAESSIRISAQVKFVAANKQEAFPKTVPAGNYSGITHLEANLYAVVNDKSDSVLWYRFQIDIDSIDGKITNVVNLGPGAYCYEHNLDEEAVAKIGNHLFLTSETQNKIKEYSIDATSPKLLREVSIPIKIHPNYGLESLTYDEKRCLLWTATESTPEGKGDYATSTNGVINKIPLLAYNDTLKLIDSVYYMMEAPLVNKPAKYYAKGVSEMCALENGSLLVMERELYVPQMLLGAFVDNQIYSVNPKLPRKSELLSKHKVYEWKTKFNLMEYSLANYEGMCLGPKLKNGNQVILLIADSQNQSGILKDWFKTIVLKTD